LVVTWPGAVVVADCPLAGVLLPAALVCRVEEAELGAAGVVPFPAGKLAGALGGMGEPLPTTEMETTLVGCVTVGAGAVERVATLMERGEVAAAGVLGVAGVAGVAVTAAADVELGIGF